MKKLKAFIFLPILSLILFLFAVSGCANTLSRTTLYNTGIEMTTLMGNMIKNSTFIELIGFSSYSGPLDNFYANDYDTPIRTYLIEVPSNEIILEKAIADKESSDKIKDLPDELKEQLRYKATFEVVINYVTFTNTNYDDIVICNSLIAQKVVAGTIKNDVAYLYTFETGKPIIVYYHQLAKDSIIVKSCFIGNDIYSTLSDTREIFEKYDCVVTLYN